MFDYLLYVALAAGYVVGRVVHWRSPWIGVAEWASVVVLVFLLGASLDAIAPTTLLTSIPVSLAYALLLVGATLVAFRALRPSPRPPAVAVKRSTTRVVPGPFLLAALVAGYFTLGRFDSATGAGVDLALYALLALVAFDLRLSRAALHRIWVPLSAAAAGALLAAGLAVVLLGLAPTAAFATALAFSWYSLAGPLVGAQLGPALGLITFLANFFREDLTMLLAAPVGRWFPHGGIAAVGGAASMDTALAFSTTYDAPDGATLGLGTGIVLTLAASLLVPGILALAGA